MSSPRLKLAVPPWTVAAVVALILAASAAPARSAPEDGPNAVSEPVFTGLKLDGKPVSGRIASLTADRLTLASGENAREELPFRSLVKLTREIRSGAPTSEGSHVLLPGGDRLMRVIVGSTSDTSLEVQSHSAIGKLTIPLDAVLGLVLAAPAETDAFDQLWDRVQGEPRSTEVVWLLNGDRMTGGFLGMDDRAIKLQIDGKPVEVDRTGVVAIGFDPAAANYPRPPSDFLELTFADGSRLGVIGASLDKGYLVATTRFGQPIRAPLADLARIDPRTEAVAYLSELKADAQSYVSYLGPTRPFRADRSVDGHRLQLQGRTYERGLGAQSRTLLAFRLKPGDKRFQAMVGVDDRAGPLGSVVFRVLTDGTPRVTTPAMTSRDTPQAIDIDVSNAKLLILATEFGDRGDVRDFADWVEARIIR